MKQLTFFLGAFLLQLSCFAQREEFEIHPNGLMYSESTMDRLQFIVDSLDLKFKNCELHKTYYSKYQAKAHYVYLKGSKVSGALRDMENNLSFEAFANKYPSVEVERDNLVVKFKYDAYYKDRETVVFNSFPKERELYFDEDPEIYDRALKGKWLFRHSHKNDPEKAWVRAFYFASEFQKQELGNKYARMVQYTDCMVDTTTQIYKENVKSTMLIPEQRRSSRLKKFMSYINKETKKPEYSSYGDDYDAFSKDYREWDSLRFAYIDEVLSKEKSFQKRLREASADALEKGGSDNEFEQYVSRYYSREIALELKRGRKVMGTCSMDRSPRIHARNIAILSAETTHWATFLRAHLDIMNDHFERASDGSYAWGKRKTYIRELEELGLNVSDLLLGISMRIENPSQNHYYGSIGRIGRALSEAREADKIEQKLLEMIRDDQLDDFNRVLMVNVFKTYNYHIGDESRRLNNVAELAMAIEKMPGYLASKLNSEE